MIVSSDAHDPSAVGNFEEARKLLAEIDFDETLILNAGVERLLFISAWRERSVFFGRESGIFSMAGQHTVKTPKKRTKNYINFRCGGDCAGAAIIVLLGRKVRKKVAIGNGGLSCTTILLLFSASFFPFCCAEVVKGTRGKNIFLLAAGLVFMRLVLFML